MKVIVEGIEMFAKGKDKAISLCRLPDGTIEVLGGKRRLCLCSREDDAEAIATALRHCINEGLI